MDGRPQLLDLIPTDKQWLTKTEEEQTTIHEEKKLELRLGPPGEDWSTISRERNHDSSLSSYTYFASPWQQQTKACSSFHHHRHGVMKESSQACSKRVELQNSAEKNKTFSPSPANPAVSTANKRTAPVVVGWPPIRSFRKNIASGGNSSKPSSDSPDPARTKTANPKPAKSSPFVKINMDGIPIGRKIDLKAYVSYENLSFAVDELFRGLLAVQSDSSCGVKEKEGIGGLLDGSGEYTLVYEDNEGDRMLVGDVPWDMFVSTVKRLRVLKSSELSTLSREGKQGKLGRKA